MGYLLNLQNKVANSVKVSFNETKYEFLLDKVIETETDEVRCRYKILINDDVKNSILIVSTLGNELTTSYKILISYNDGASYTTPFNKSAGKDFPMDITFDIIKFLNN